MPKVLYFGQKNTENIMIMELLGPSIESLFNICERHFSIKTVCMIGKQLVRISFFFFFFLVYLYIYVFIISITIIILIFVFICFLFVYL